MNTWNFVNDLVFCSGNQFSNYSVWLENRPHVVTTEDFSIQHHEYMEV